MALVVDVVELTNSRNLSELEKAGFIQRFENAWKLGWKVLADYLKEREDPVMPRTPGSAIRLARATGLIDDGDDWANAGKLRTVLTHEYSLDHRDEGLMLITTRYLPMMVALGERMERRLDHG